jgi:hypothetical protein
MNSRFAPIDARNCSVMHPAARIGAQVRTALHPCPGEGSGGSS